MQPYRFLQELCDRYTETVITATQKRAETIKEEATQWMREHAPWQDKTVYEPGTDKKKIKYPAGTARKGLRAVVVKDERSAQIFEDLMAKAKNQDNIELARRRERRLARLESAKRRASSIRAGRGPLLQTIRHPQTKKGRHPIAGASGHPVRILDLGKPPDPKAAERYEKAFKKRKWYKRIHSLPKSVSAVAKVEQRFRGQVPLVDVHFTHNTRLPYVIWLEIANQGRYAIISRTIAYWGPKLFKEIETIARLKQYREKIAFGPESPTAREEFESYAALRTAQTGHPYQAWSEEIRLARAERRREYREGGKQKVQEAARRTAEYREKLGKPLSRYEEPTYTGPTLNLNRMSTRRR